MEEHMADLKKLTLGALIDKLDAAREKKREINEDLKVAEAAYNEVEDEVKNRLMIEGMDKATGKRATVSLSKVVVANVTDWDAFYAYVKKTGYFHLFQRRVSDPAWRELSEKKPVPGTEPFEKLNLNLRSLKIAA
jgi:hypothetical protein